MSTLVGMQLDGRYRLDALIGTGGMSTVYRAWDLTLEREVAIKLMHREVAADSDQLERFRREARAVAQLSHPHVVTVIDAGEDQGRPYIVFEYVPGETLKEHIRRCGKLDIPEAVAYAIEIARALGAAHAAHIVHRDVKPQNVLIDAEGSAKVTDFGIARTLDEAGLTAEGRVLGTTDYVSPEQALGHGVTGQSDLYSLGIVLYEMLTGDVPFHGENQVAVAMKHVREQLPDVQYRRPEVSAALAAVIDRATDKELTRRYGTADELIWDLEDALAVEAARSGHATGEATSVLHTLPESRFRRLPLRVRLRQPAWALFALLVVIAAAAAVILFGLSENTQRGTGSPVNEPREPGLQAVSLGQAAAGDYDPIGGDGEHPEEAAFVVDRDRSTTWSTETYSGPLNKEGVGVYVDADPGVAASALDVRTNTKGWKGAIYAAEGDSPPKDIGGWTKLAGPDVIDDERHRFRFDTKGKKYRYYLVWITDLADNDQVEVAEVTLYESKASPSSRSSSSG